MKRDVAVCIFYSKQIFAISKLCILCQYIKCFTDFKVLYSLLSEWDQFVCMSLLLHSLTDK